MSKEEMKITELPKVNFIPKRCKDCIFEKVEYDHEPMWGDGWSFDCNLKYWLGICKDNFGVHCIPCPLDGKSKDHYDGRKYEHGRYINKEV